MKLEERTFGTACKHTHCSTKVFSFILQPEIALFAGTDLKQEVSTPLNAYTEALNGKSADF